MSVMDLYMKELLLQQKLAKEYQIQQQQQSPPSSSSIITSAALQPQQLPVTFMPEKPQQPEFNHQQQQQNQLFNDKTAFLQFTPPPTVFDSFAAAVAANFVHNFGSNQQPKMPLQYTSPPMPFYPMGMMPSSMMFGGGMPYQMPYSSYGFPMFTDFNQSPSCGSLNSAGSCASLDSFPSSGLPSSPDDSSCSSFLNAPFPLNNNNNTDYNGKNWQRELQKMAATAAIEAITKKTFIEKAAKPPMDFSALMAKDNSKQNLSTEIVSQQKQVPTATPLSGKQQKQSVNVKHANSTVDIDVRRPIAAVAAIDHRRPSASEEPPKKMGRRSGATIFVPMKFAPTIGKSTKTADQPKIALNDKEAISTSLSTTTAHQPLSSTFSSSSTAALMITLSSDEDEDKNDFDNKRDNSAQHPNATPISNEQNKPRQLVHQQRNKQFMATKAATTTKTVLSELNDQILAQQDHGKMPTMLDVPILDLEEQIVVEKEMVEAMDQKELPPKADGTQTQEENECQEENVDMEDKQLREDEEDDAKIGTSDEEAEEVEKEESTGQQKVKLLLCRWTKCKERFKDQNQLYDHLNIAHVDQLKKWIVAEHRELEQQQQRKVGLKRCRSNGGGARASNSNLNSKERFRCRWRNCNLYPSRGDAQKKFDWLLGHLVSRHAPKARPFKCLFTDCTLRFVKQQALNDHLRSTHDDANGRGNGRKSANEDAKPAKKVPCLEFQPRPRLPFVRDCIDTRTVELLRCLMSTSNNTSNSNDFDQLREQQQEEEAEEQQQLYQPCSSSTICTTSSAEAKFNHHELLALLMPDSMDIDTRDGTNGGMPAEQKTPSVEMSRAKARKSLSSRTGGTQGIFGIWTRTTEMKQQQRQQRVGEDGLRKLSRALEHDELGILPDQVFADCVNAKHTDHDYIGGTLHYSKQRRQQNGGQQPMLHWKMAVPETVAHLAGTFQMCHRRNGKNAVAAQHSQQKQQQLHKNENNKFMHTKHIVKRTATATMA